MKILRKHTLILAVLALFSFTAFASDAKKDQPTKAKAVYEQLINHELDMADESTKEIISDLRFGQKMKLLKMAATDVESFRDGEVTDASVGMYIIAILLPPLAVALHTGSLGATLLNIILTVLGYIPGLIHAIIVLGV